jgi:hypothetical protein
MRRSRLLKSFVIAGAAVTFTLMSFASATAGPVVKPSPTCKVPVLSVSRTTAVPGTTVRVSGINFSGCTAQGSSAKPTPVLTVKVGVVTAAKVTEVLATTKTTARGTFSVEITVPKVSAGGQSKIALAASSTDPATKLSYIGATPIAYAAAPTTTTSSASPAPTSTANAAPSSSSSVDVPTAVPAGSGGFGAPTGGAEIGTEVAIAGVGAALIAFSGVGLARRRSRQH